MDVILNFAALRVHRRYAPALTLATTSEFQRSLAGGDAGPPARAEAAELARAFIGAHFLHKADEVAYGDQLLTLLHSLRSTGVRAPIEEPRLEAELREALGGAQPASFAADLDRARDSVVARYLVEEGPAADVAAGLVRMFTLARVVIEGTPTAEQIDSILRGPMALPEVVLALPSSSEAGDAPSPDAQARGLVERLNAAAQRHQQLSETLEAIEYHAADELVVEELGEQRPLTALEFATSAAATPALVLDADADRQATIRLPLEPEPSSALLRAGALRNVVLSETAVRLLPESTSQVMQTLQLDPARSPLHNIVSVVTAERDVALQQVRGLAKDLAVVPIVIDPSLIFDPSWILEPVDDPEKPAPVATAAPTTHASIEPLGIADLLLVRAHISHYERGEVAAIENVLANEKLTHTIRQLDVVETQTTDDRESTDLRTQMQRAAEEASGHTTVQAIGPGVGPVAAEGPTSFARSVTDEVSSSSTSRRRRLVVQRQLREREEIAEHLVDGTASPATRHGVYQWLDRVYTAQAFSYGSRLLYDVIVPEPAAVFREALGRPRGGGSGPVRPARFTLDPTDLDVHNWAYYATGHQATGVEPPPPREVVVTEPFAAKAKDSFANDSTTKTIVHAETRSTRIPKGYKADRYKAWILGSSYDPGYLRGLVGSKTFQVAPLNGAFFRSGSLSAEVDSLPVGIMVESDGVSFGAQTFNVGVEVICEATPELLTAWQVKAHGQIVAANQRRFEDYEEHVANRDASARVFLQGMTPARRGEVLRTEMKRATLAVLTAQSFSGFNTTTTDPGGFPFPNPTATAALSAYIRFFEQAVEWDHLAYAFFPYFWGAQSSWVSKLLAPETDPTFAGFLTSGAARVVLPIRPGYERAFERFLHTGTTPTTQQLLDVGSPLWVSLVDELRGQSSSDRTETPVGDSWRFRLASDLVYARDDDAIPRWAFAQGQWQDSADPAF